MSEQTEQSRSRRPTSVSVFAIINGLGLLLTILFWGIVYFKRLVPTPGDLITAAERVNAATTYGFMIGDIIWSAPLLLLAAIGLWRQRFWGWTAAQMVNILWVYSMTVIWYRDIYTTISPGALLFFPFALIALWSIFSLWHHRSVFWAHRDSA